MGVGVFVLWATYHPEDFRVLVWKTDGTVVLHESHQSPGSLDMLWRWLEPQSEYLKVPIPDPHSREAKRYERSFLWACISPASPAVL